MEYRIGTMADWPAIVAFVAKQEYFCPVNPASRGGIWILAFDPQKNICGTLWFFDQKPNAYVDFWAADGPKTAARLGAVAENVFKYLGVEYVLGVVAAENSNAIKLAGGLGMVTDASKYALIYKRIQSNGAAEDDTGNDNTRSRRAGVTASPAPC